MKQTEDKVKVNLYRVLPSGQEEYISCEWLPAAEGETMDGWQIKGGLNRDIPYVYRIVDRATILVG